MAFAYDVEINGMHYNLDNENKTAEVTGGGDYISEITIPSSITYNDNTYSVTSIGNSAFNFHTELTTITIPNSVTSIGDYAFSLCSSLASITIPNSVTHIGESVFVSCKKLTKIDVDSNNDHFTSVDGVLYNKDITTLLCCPEAKTSISIPNSVTSIGVAAFLWCSSLTTIVIPDKVSSIESQTFRGCELLTSITIGNSVTSIGDFAFEFCTSLTSITIPNSVTSIGDCAFLSCSSLSSITIPNSVTYIGSSAFFETPWLNNQPDGCFYINNCLYSYKGEMPTNTHIDIKEGTTQICSGAFYGYTSLMSISIPNSITYIGDATFGECTSLTSIIIPNKVTYIGDETFYGCSSLDTITSLNNTPPTADNLGANTETCVLVIPQDAYNNYSNHAYWSQFYKIETIAPNFTITTAVNDNAMGSVSEGGEYAYGTEITLTATANSGYRFTQWSDGNTDNPRTITVTENKTYTAEFEVETFTITTASEMPSMGGVEVILNAKPIEGFEFVEWTDGNTDNPRILTLTENIEVYARFQIAQGGNPVDLETSKISSANIYTTNGTLHVEGATDDYHILDAAGRLIYSGNATTLQLPRGIYLVTINGEVEKIVL